MNKRREITLLRLYDVTPALSCSQITTLFIGNGRPQVNESDFDLLTHMVISQINKGFGSCSGQSQKVNYSGKSVACNLCAFPCSSCFHGRKVPMRSTGVSSAETSKENVVVDRGKQPVQLSEMSTVAGVNSTPDSASENAVGKASPRISDVSVTYDNVVHSKFEARRVLEGHDDCFSCASGTDEHANKKCNFEDSRIKYGEKSKASGETSDKVPSSGSPTGLSSQSSGLAEISPSKSASDVTELQCIFSRASNGKYMLYSPNSRDIDDDKPADTKGELLEGSTELLNSLPTAELASDVASGDTPASDANPIEKNDDMEVEIQPIDETDDSDMVEHDVKVCDICGDAGQEELLAVCCWCSDGAEHTYCMREMLDKVPEVDWMCEECKLVEQIGNERPDKRLDENEKNYSYGQASGENVNSSDIEGQQTKGYMKIPGKRLRDDADSEVSSIVKKPSLESVVGSPKTSNSSKTSALSCESSLKSLDKGRLQSSHHSSLDTVPVNGTLESARTASNPQLQNFRGAFSKSNSFNSLNSKPKVKLVDQVVLQRQILAREHATFRRKEGVARSIGKSLSFRSANSVHFETKMKTLSPRLSHIQDGKNTKQWSSFEHQSSFKTEHPSINSMMGTSGSYAPRTDKKPASGGESSSHTATTNHHEVKPVTSDVKSAALSRSSSLVARRNADLSSSFGEFKRLSLDGHSTPEVLSTNGANSTEQKSNQISLKESSCSGVAEGPPFNESMPDGLSRSRDFANSGDRMREYSGSSLRPSSVKSSRDEGNILKAAIEAAVFRKPGVCPKHRALGQSDNSSVSSVSYEMTSRQDHIPSSAGNKNLSSVAELSEGSTLSQHSKDDFLKQESLNNVNLSPLVPVDGLSSGRDAAAVVTSNNGKCSLRDTFINVPTALPFFSKSLAIPEHEYIWQGSFEICRSGKIFVSWKGVQAHLSTCASPKVIEAVNKFKSRIVLYEVPRLSTWPVQFQQHGVREDNIALFFFARDLESYDKIYKLLLGNMMKNDLALRGNFNGVELLIFPSNQLPDNSQRWNMLFFLWGVFRGKKVSSLQHMPESVEQCNASQDMPPAIVSSPENKCSLTAVGNNLPASEHAAPAPNVRAAQELASILSSKNTNGDCNAKISSSDQLDSGRNSSSSVAVQGDRVNQCQELNDNCLEGGIISSCSAPLQAASSAESTGRERMLMQLDTPLDRPQSSDHHNNSSAGNHAVEGIGDRTISDRKTSCRYLVKSKMNAEDLLRNGETHLKKDQDIKYLNMEHNRWLLNASECLHPESCVMPHNLYPGSSLVLPGNDDTRDGPSGTLEKVNHAATGSCAPENRHHGGCDETGIPKYSENAERHFFPMKIQPVTGTHLVDRPRPWRMHTFEQNRLHDRAPNLELALGAEIKPLSQGNRPPLVRKADRETNEEHIFHDAGSKAEDDLSASLSLSLSFPFQ